MGSRVLQEITAFGISLDSDQPSLFVKAVMETPSSAFAVRGQVLLELAEKAEKIAVTVIILLNPSHENYNRFAWEFNSLVSQIAKKPITIFRPYRQVAAGSGFSSSIWDRVIVVHVPSTGTKILIDPVRGQVEEMFASLSHRELWLRKCRKRRHCALTENGKQKRATLQSVGDAAHFAKASALNPKMTNIGATVAELEVGASLVSNLLTVASYNGSDDHENLKIAFGDGDVYTKDIQSDESQLPRVPLRELYASSTVSHLFSIAILLNLRQLFFFK